MPALTRETNPAANAASTPDRLTLREITKSYPGVLANDSVSLSVAPGEIHGLIGENGAGKSTLMKIAYGLVQPDAGELIWEGRPVRLGSPAEARALGIGMVFQHFSLFESLTVAENVALVLPGARTGQALSQQIRDCGERYGLPVEPDRHIHDLSVGERQRVEIIRCLLLSPTLLILDEPTSVLTPQASEALFGTLRQLSDEGTSVLYISHKLHEIRSLCHRATVLRGGRVVGQCVPSQTTTEALSQMMLGAPPPGLARKAAHESAEIRLLARNIAAEPVEPFGSPVRIDEIALRAGEILGIAGVSGNGQNEIMDLLAGERLLPGAAANAATLTLMGRDIRRAGVDARRRAGLAFVPEERYGRGAVPGMALSWNTLLTHHGSRLSRAGFVRSRRMRELAAGIIGRFGVKTPGEGTLAGSLSGGNLQKFIVGREIMKNPQVLLVAQPTWGVDVGAAALIHQALLDLRGQGAAILVVSEDLDELFELCDRIQVVARGRLSAPIPVEQADVAQIGRLMGGIDEALAA